MGHRLLPPGPAGAHQVSNATDEPARVLILSTRQLPEIAEYPDSGKQGAFSREGFKMYMADSGVDYWEGE